MKESVDINTLKKNVKLSHVTKDAKTDTSKHAGTATTVKEYMLVNLNLIQKINMLRRIKSRKLSLRKNKRVKPSDRNI